MNNGHYLIRNDNVQKVYLTENTLDVFDILSENYGYICHAIKEEGFSIKSPTCSLFKEIVFENKVVGFCSYDFSREFITAALNNIYVLPEFRGNGLFISELKKTMEEHNKPSIIEPTRLIVELLVEYGFARHIGKDIVASSIEFIVPGEHVLSNASYDSQEELSTHFYDLNICASIHFLDLDKSKIAYSYPLNYDIIHYDCLNERKKIYEGYFDEIKEFFMDNEGEILKIIVDLEENLPIKTYTLEEVIGEGDEMSPYIESLIDDAHVTHQKALEIRQQIKEEYEAGMILNESLLVRLAYLFEKPEAKIKSHSEKCPYCDMPIDDHDKFCHFCGVNLDYNPDEMFDSLINSLDGPHDEGKEDIRYVAYKFLKLIEENIEIDYAICTIESTYNISWVDLRAFLYENNYFSSLKITDDGYEFMLNHPLNFYEEFDMTCVDYTDFEKYFYDNGDLSGIDICLNYLNQFEGRDFDEVICEIKKVI